MISFPLTGFFGFTSCSRSKAIRQARLQLCSGEDMACASLRFTKARGTDETRPYI